MAQIYDFPKRNVNEHKWYHFLYTSVALRHHQYDCLYCEKCNRWLIRKEVAGRFLYIEKWVEYSDFKDIIEENVLVELKPKLVWRLLKLENFFRRFQNDSK